MTGTTRKCNDNSPTAAFGLRRKCDLTSLQTVSRSCLKPRTGPERSSPCQTLYLSVLLPALDKFQRGSSPACFQLVHSRTSRTSGLWPLSPLLEARKAINSTQQPLASTYYMYYMYYLSINWRPEQLIELIKNLTYIDNGILK